MFGSVRPVHILLAEDNPADQRLISEALNICDLHHELHVVSDGEEALAEATKAGSKDHAPCPDVFILDLGLPRIEGIDVLRAFRSNSNCTDTPVVVFTASVRPTDQAIAEQFAGVRFVRKPMDLDEFLLFGRTVKSMLLRAEGQ